MIVKFVLICSLLASPALASAVKGYADSGTKGGSSQRLSTPVERHHEAAAAAATKTAATHERQWEQQQQQVLQAPTKTIRQELPAATKSAEHRQWVQPAPAPVSGKTSLPERAEQQREEYTQQQLATSPIEEQREHREQQREELSQQKEEHYSAATKGAATAHYEARTQVRLEESKGGSRLEQQRLEEQPVAATKSIKSSDESLKLEQQKLEQQRLEQHKLELQRLEQQKLEQQRLEQERLEQQRLEQQRLEQQRLDQQRLEQQRLDLQKLEQQRLEQQRLDQQRLEQQRLEQQKLEQHQQRLEQIQQQREEQQVVELNRDLYEQRRFSEDQQQIVQLVQQKEETKGGYKGQVVQQQQQQQLVAEPEPYAFDYSVEGSSRRESGDTKGVVRGQYTLQGADGTSRIVDYIADHNGFRATVNTNEFGTESRSPAGVEIRSSQPAAEDISLRLEGKTREFLEAPQPAPAAGAIKGAPAPLEPPKRPENWSVKQGPLTINAPAPIVPQAPLVVVEEAPRAIRGKTVEEIKSPAAPIVQQRELLHQQKLDSERDLQQQQQEIAPELPARESSPALAKGELRAPKAIGELKRGSDETELLGHLRAATFESATAHHQYQPHAASPASVAHRQHSQHNQRDYQQQQGHHQPTGGLRSIIRPAVVAAPPAPIAPSHHRQHVGAATHQQPITRSQFQYDRHAQPVAPLRSPSSSSSSHIRGHEPSPRLTFYGNSGSAGAGASSESFAALDDSAASFEQPSAE